MCAKYGQPTPSTGSSSGLRPQPSTSQEVPKLSNTSSVAPCRDEYFSRYSLGSRYWPQPWPCGGISLQSRQSWRKTLRSVAITEPHPALGSMQVPLRWSWKRRRDMEPGPLSLRWNGLHADLHGATPATYGLEKTTSSMESP
ncbi:hypothetical protein PsYK624_117940 [Phanerochaete sordida]|uniref:Uncharacterized protein n=1 Tax=Phanerochaete sordida TaxID=48140 RepID=A0A9P3LI11_9APHY|nr:hypothetical protein PsYK624_117940 [Phanerochaete sordida]